MNIFLSLCAVLPFTCIFYHFASHHLTIISQVLAILLMHVHSTSGIKCMLFESNSIACECIDLHSSSPACYLCLSECLYNGATAGGADTPENPAALHSSRSSAPSGFRQHQIRWMSGHRTHDCLPVPAQSLPGTAALTCPRYRLKLKSWLL